MRGRVCAIGLALAAGCASPRFRVPAAAYPLEAEVHRPPQPVATCGEGLELERPLRVRAALDASGAVDFERSDVPASMAGALRGCRWTPARIGERAVPAFGSIVAPRGARGVFFAPDRIGDVDLPGGACPTPAYPPRAIHDWVEGCVEFEATVDVDGRVRDTALVSEAPAELVESSRESIRQCYLTPALRADQRIRVRIPLRFCYVRGYEAPR